MSTRSPASRLVRVALATLTACALTGAVSVACAWAQTPPEAAYVPHQVLVGYAPAPIPLVTAQLETRMGIRATPGAPPGPRSRLLALPRGESVLAAIRRLRHQPGVAYAQPNYIAQEAGGFYPNDPGRSGQPQGWE
ncbi:MAG: hypothetical protein M3010_02965, partial [Candidatus Dormibacteraeota bacterium]|nr:hypothetical protein [Candidatus Dormibacteraeota bacterium]